MKKLLVMAGWAALALRTMAAQPAAAQQTIEFEPGVGPICAGPLGPGPCALVQQYIMTHPPMGNSQQGSGSDRDRRTTSRCDLVACTPETPDWIIQLMCDPGRCFPETREGPCAYSGICGARSLSDFLIEF